MSFDAFISYSHAADGLLAPRLQDGLQRFAKPWWRRRALHVFRDETGLSVNPGLWTAIAAAMDDSRYFVLLASPEAANSEWVNREIEHWTAHNDPASILCVLTDGEWVWDPETNDFDPVKSSAVPVALCGVFAEEPRHTDMRWARGDAQLDLRNGRFRDQVAEIAAPMHGIAKEDLAGVDVIQHRRTLRTAWGAAIALLMLVALSGTTALAAVNNASRAHRNETIALDARRKADASAAQAQQAEAAAQASAAESTRQKQAADASAAEATRQKQAADASAADAASQQQAAEASAADAASQQQAAEASAAEATQQQQVAEGSAEQARLAKLDADASAASALMQEQAAETAKRAADASAAEALQQQRAAEKAKAEADAAKADTQAANDALTTANGDLDAARLVALADNERIKGNFDTAMLLANEAIDASRTDPTGARNEALAIQNEIRSVVRYLPGPPIADAAIASIVAGRDHVALTADNVIQVWNLRRAGDQHVVDLSGVVDGQVVSVKFSEDGTRLIVGTLPTGGFGAGRVSILDSDNRTAKPLWQSSPSGISNYRLSPDGTAVAVEEDGVSGPVVALVDLRTLEVAATWPGQLLSSFAFSGDPRFASSSCGIISSSSQCDFSADGRYLLGWSDSTATFVLWDRQSAKQTTNLYTPQFPDDGHPVPLPAFISAGGLVLGLPDPSTLVAYDPNGDPHPAVAITTGLVRSMAVAPDGRDAYVVDASGSVTRLDLVADVTTVLTQVTSSCPFDNLTIALSRLGQWALVTGPVQCDPDLFDPGGAAFVPTNGPSDPVALRSSGSFASLVAVARSVEGVERYAIDSTGGVVDLQTGATSHIGPAEGSSCAAPPAADKLVCGTSVVGLDPFVPDATGGVLGIPTAAFTFPVFDPSGDRIFGFVFTQGGRVWTADLRRTAAGPIRYSTATAFGGTVTALSPDATELAVGGSDGGVVIHSTVSRATTTLSAQVGFLSSVAFAGTDRLLVSGYDLPAFEVKTEVWNVRTGELVGTRPGSMTASGDGRLLAVTDCHQFNRCAIDLVSSVDLHAVRRGVTSVTGGTLALNHDGSLLAILIDGAQTFTSRLVVIDTGSGATVTDLSTDVPTTFSPRLAFSPDNKAVIGAFVVGDLYMARIDIHGQNSVGIERVDRTSCVGSDAQPTFSPDGRLVFVDGQFFDSATLNPVGPPVTCGLSAAVPAVFAPAGAALDYVTETSTPLPGDMPFGLDVHRISLEPGELRASACAIAGRNLTTAEWAKFEPGVPYHPTCVLRR